MSPVSRVLLPFLLLAASSLSAVAGESSSDAARYTFSWPLAQVAAKPRGATTQDTEVTPVEGVPAAWHALSASGYQLQAVVDQAHLFVPFFRYAQALADGEEEFDIKTADALIADTLKRDYLVPASEGE
ncbi:MAG: hypothetical protein GX826_13395 [Gammaproteobacteria bacterium]|nr:hypothetical protein [Gammaproteobacteria bacterium]